MAPPPKIWIFGTEEIKTYTDLVHKVRATPPVKSDLQWRAIDRQLGGEMSPSSPFVLTMKMAHHHVALHAVASLNCSVDWNPFGGNAFKRNIFVYAEADVQPWAAACNFLGLIHTDVLWHTLVQIV